VSTWEAYSAFVRAMVTMRSEFVTGTDHIYMVTYLFLPPLRWFNNGSIEESMKQSFLNKYRAFYERTSEEPPIDLEHPCFSYHHIVGRWEEYTEFAMEIAKEDDHRLIRYLLCYEDTVVENIMSLGVRESHLYEERTRAKLESALSSWVLCDRETSIPYQFDMSNRDDLRVFDEAAGWKSECAAIMKDYYELGKNQYREANRDGEQAKFRVYLIVPDEGLANPSAEPRENLRWIRLGQVFDEQYQAKHGSYEDGLYYTVIDLDAFKKYFATRNPTDTVPEDFFVLGRGQAGLSKDGIAEQGAIEKLFGLAVVNPDEYLNKLEFHFLMPGQSVPEPTIGDMDRIFNFIQGVCNQEYRPENSQHLGSRSVASLVSRLNQERGIL